MKNKIETFISSSSTCTVHCRTVVCFIAGILTYRNNFEAAAYEISKRYRNAKILMIFPYGMADGTHRSSLIRFVARQFSQVGYDLTHERSRRVTNVAQLIREQRADADQLILIGHSAGGVIAYRVGLKMEKEYDFRTVQVFAVGCPKFHLKDIPYNDRFTYITGQNPDRVTQMGSWRRPGSRVYRGRPGREITVHFNPAHEGWRFHASYFLKSAWTDSNQVFHTNAEDLVAKIHELYPGNG
ncbi:alpha/beta hydrolase [Paenibacillus sp. HJL G12]|uniref:Alpha/beta hydrolase n=1 Tax=Paenibacillus dendrobii TaxID=2691084 RepID=A0A7X3LGQ0_9BACL|nr:alpha/beta hydrolase [Paenibacillus dendrobii]MWV42728.1 alpha/beta hydrolase [Paenibacillus dendrobii]